MIELFMKIGATAAFVALPALLVYANAKRDTFKEKFALEVAALSVSAAYFCGIGGAILWFWGAR